MLKVGIYIRVSTDEQVTEGFSIQAQRNKLEAYCVSQGWDIIGFYVDEGISAKDTERPELKRMIKHIEQGVIECVLVYRLDRLTRSVLDLYNLLELFKKNNCMFKSATEVYDTTTAMGRMFITLVAALAQWERENLAERVRMGLQEKARQGKWAMSTAPFGYELDSENDTLKIKESEARIVRKLYEMYLNGISARKIAVEFNKKKFTNDSIPLWYDTRVLYILKNPVYKGAMRYNYRVNKENYFEVDDSVPAIITKEMYEEAQKVLKTRSQTHPRRATSDFIFSGVARCGGCGSPLHGKRSQSKRGDKIYRMKSYQCHKKKIGACKMPNVSENYIENRFLKVLQTWDISKEIEGEDYSLEKNDTAKQIEQIKNELSTIEKRRKKWQYAWANDKINDDDFTQRMEEENEKEKSLKVELDELHPHLSSSDDIKIESIISDLVANWKNMTDVEKKQAVQLTTKRFYVERISRKLSPECIKIINLEFH